MSKLFRVMRSPDGDGGGGTAGTDDKSGQGSAGAGSTGDNAGAGSAGDKGAQGDKGAGTPAFAVPKEYAEKGWAKKVKSQDDVYKLVDNLDSVAGKKFAIPDLSKSDDPQVKEYLNNLRGDTKIEDYQFGDGIPKTYAEKVAKLLYDRGINKSIGNPLIKEYQAIVKAEMEAQFSAEGYKEAVGRVFGDNKQRAAEVVNVISELLGPEGKTHLETKIPNVQVEFMYKFVNAVLEKYGVKETGAGAGGGEGGGNGEGDVNKKRSEIRTKMANLVKGTHTQAQKDALQKELDATYGIK